MGCNCKSGKEQKLNNLDSKDHLKVAFDVYKDLIEGKESNHQWDEADSNLLIQTYRMIYPNAKMHITTEIAVVAIKHIYNQFYGK